MIGFTWIRLPLLVLLSGLLVITSVQAEPVKLTVLLPFSNIYKQMGSNAKEGFLLGVQTAAAEQNVNWKSWVTFEFLDTRADKTHSLRLTKDAIANGSKAIFGFISSAVALHQQDYVLNEAHVPFVIFGAATSSKLRQQNPLFLRVTKDARHYILPIGLWLKKHPFTSAQRPRWACIHADYSWGVSICDGFKSGYQDMGEEIGRIPVPLKTVSKKREIVELVKLKPDFVVAAFAGGEAAIFVRDYFRFKVHEKFPLVMPGPAFSDSLLKKYSDTLEQYGTGVDVVSADTYFSSQKNTANQRFVADYQQAYKKLPDAFSIGGYDAGWLLIKALVQLQGQWDGQKIVQLMRTLPYISPRHGRQLQFDTHGDVMNSAYIFKTKRDGNRLVSEILGQVPPMNTDKMLK